MSELNTLLFQLQETNDIKRREEIKREFEILQKQIESMVSKVKERGVQKKTGEQIEETRKKLLKIFLTGNPYLDQEKYKHAKTELVNLKRLKEVLSEKKYRNEFGDIYEYEEHIPEELYETREPKIFCDEDDREFKLWKKE